MNTVQASLLHLKTENIVFFNKLTKLLCGPKVEPPSGGMVNMKFLNVGDHSVN